MLGEQSPVVIIYNRKRIEQVWLTDFLNIATTQMIRTEELHVCDIRIFNFWFPFKYRVTFANLSRVVDQVLRYRNPHI